jgi:hypothetical protein
MSSSGTIRRMFAAATLLMTGLLLVLMLSASANAQQKESYSGNGPKVEPSVQGTSEREVESDVLSRSNVLPFTGGDVVLFVAIAGAAIGTGLILVRRARPAREANTTD